MSDSDENKGEKDSHENKESKDFAKSVDSSENNVSDESKINKESDENKGDKEADENKGNKEPDENKGNKDSDDDKGNKDSNENKGSKDNRTQVCRDFLRNVCLRHDCKYYHPNEKEKDLPAVRSKILTFCHDYQNGNCTRYPCKFLHCTDQEEIHYRETGELPARVLDEPWNKWITAELNSAKLETIPVCKDFINGICSRRRCRFRHLSMGELESMNNPGSFRRPPFEEESMFRRHRRRPFIDDYGPMYKRRRFMDTPYTSNHQNGLVRQGRGVFALEEENYILRQRVAQLKRRANGFLSRW